MLGFVASRTFVSGRGVRSNSFSLYINSMTTRESVFLSPSRSASQADTSDYQLITQHQQILLPPSEAGGVKQKAHNFAAMLVREMDHTPLQPLSGI